MTTIRKAKMSPENVEEARRLRAIWDSKKHESQAIFGERYNIGNQSSVGQFLNGAVPLSLKAALGFARGLGCLVDDFSPRLAADRDRLFNDLNAGENSLKRAGIPLIERPLANSASLVYVVGRDEDGRLPSQVWSKGALTPDGMVAGIVARVSSQDPYAFAIEVQGINMIPRFFPGEFALVEPTTIPGIEDDVIVRLTSGKDFIRRLASDLDEETLQLTSYHDPSVLNIKKVDIAWMHIVVHPFPKRRIVTI